MIVLGVFGAVVIAGLIWLRRRYVMVTVYGESMLPTYRPGERLVVRRMPPDAVRAGQVVVLAGFAHARPARLTLAEAVRSPRWMVKRVAAAPGDPIPRDTVPALRRAPGTRVPAGHLVVLGDNADRSYDSRHAGYLTTDRLLGVVLRSAR